MAFLAQLWLPIVLSAVVVFFLSAAVHMAMPWRKREWGRMGTRQDALQAALRGLAPGQYGFPAPEEPMARMSKEWLARWETGPAGWLTVEVPGPMAMGRKLGLSFAAYLGVSFLVGYVASLSLGPSSPTLLIVRVISTVGFLTYGVGTIFNSVWYGRPWRLYVLDVVDALIYGFAMAGVFAWLWPR